MLLSCFEHETINHILGVLIKGSMRLFQKRHDSRLRPPAYYKAKMLELHNFLGPNPNPPRPANGAIY